jgi:hypothetical protein
VHAKVIVLKENAGGDRNSLFRNTGSQDLMRPKEFALSFIPKTDRPRKEMQKPDVPRLSNVTMIG